MGRSENFLKRVGWGWEVTKEEGVEIDFTKFDFGSAPTSTSFPLPFPVKDGYRQ